MTTIIGRWGVTLVDARGQRGKTGSHLSYLNTSAATRGDAQLLASNLLSLVSACSNGAVVAGTGLASATYMPNLLGTAATYETVEDKAVLVYLTLAGTLHRLEIPAPIAAVFLADQETVNKAQANIAALTAAMTATTGAGNFPSDRSGIAFGSLIAGFRSRRRWQRKTTIWTLTPDLAGPEE